MFAAALINRLQLIATALFITDFIAFRISSDEVCSNPSRSLTALGGGPPFYETPAHSYARMRCRGLKELHVGLPSELCHKDNTNRVSRQDIFSLFMLSRQFI